MSLTNFPNGVTSFGQVLYGGEAPVMGKVYHVRKEADANYDEWFSQMDFRHYDGSRSVQATIEGAVDIADDFDTIWVYPGQWKPTKTVAITQDSLRLLAVQAGPRRALTRTEIRQHGNIDTPIASVEGAHNVEIAGFRLTPYAIAGTAINAGQVSASYGLYIHDNYFYGTGSGATGPCMIRLGVDAGIDCDSAYISNNDIYLGGASNTSTGMIEWNSATRAQIVGNSFWQHGNVATAFGINIYDALAFRGGILDNIFTNIEVGLTGSEAIAINNPTPAGGDGIIDGNHFVNYSDKNNCIAVTTVTSLGINYLNATVIAVT